MFRENMTFIEAQTVLFREADGKTDEEKKQLLEEFGKVLPAITNRELEQVDEGWIF